MAVFRLCHVATSAACASGSVGRPAWATNSDVSRLAIRSLPPPMRSRRPYSSSDHWTGSPNSRNVWLTAGKCPYRSVSARTPSQSKMSVLIGLPGLPVAAEHPDVVLRHRHHRATLGGEDRRRVVLAGVLRHEVVARLHERDLQRGRDVHLRAAPGDEIGELL